MISNEKNETMLIYHSEKSDDRKARGYVEALNGYVVKTWDLKKDPITGTQLAEIANRVNVPIPELIDPSYYLDIGNGEQLKEMDDENILALIVNDPMQLKTPILLIDGQAFQCDSSYELIKEKMNE